MNGEKAFIVIIHNAVEVILLGKLTLDLSPKAEKQWGNLQSNVFDAMQVRVNGIHLMFL